MTRKHRSVHRILWPLLAVVIAIGIALAFILHVPGA
jgi:hypothetical protein